MTADKTPEDASEEPSKANFLVDEITVLPNAHIPIVMNSKFEFVPYESRLNEDPNPLIARIDINKLTQVQLREPPARISDYYRDASLPNKP